MQFSKIETTTHGCVGMTHNFQQSTQVGGIKRVINNPTWM
jgi:hypothetical protein